LRSGISTISPRSKSDPASNGGWRVNVGLLLAEMAILLFFPLPARPQATPPDSETHGNLTFSLNPQDVNMQLFSWFIQEEIALVPDKLYLTVGTNVDHNYYTGFNTLPSARVAWTASSHHMFWAAISQADRTPAETDTGSRTNFAGFRGPEGTPTLVALVGNTHIDDEGMTSCETGYRTTLLRDLSINLAAYYSDYNHQQTTEPSPFFETSPAPPHLVLPLTYQNLMHREAHGFEIRHDRPRHEGRPRTFAGRNGWIHYEADTFR
jgi:outer membrane receptor for ferrienterochelin and colicin